MLRKGGAPGKGLRGDVDRAVESSACEPRAVNSAKKSTYWSAVRGSFQAPLRDLRAGGGLRFRTGVRAAGNTCLSSGTEASGMVLLQPLLLSTHQHSTHDSTSLAGGGGSTSIHIPLRLYMAVGREEIGVLVGRGEDAGCPEQPL